MRVKYRHSTFIFLVIGIFFTGVIYLEWQKSIHDYHAHTIEDFQFRYEDKLNTYAKLGEISSHMIEMHMPAMLQQHLTKQPPQDFLAIQTLLRKEDMTNIQIYSLQGDLLLNSQAVPTSDHTLLGYNTLLQNAMQTKEAAFGLLFTSTFQGFRYVGVLNPNHQHVGYAQISIPMEHIVAYLDESMHSTSYFMYQKTFLGRGEQNQEWTKQFTPLDAQGEYYLIKTFSHAAIPNALKILSHQLVHRVITSEGIALSFFTTPFDAHLAVILPVYNYNQEVVGLLVSIQNDSKYILITFFQILKIAVLWFVLGLLYYFYRNNQRTESLLEQYKEAVDISALVSKTNTAGRITYVNEPFVKLSGYSAQELLGHNHRIIRAPEMPHHVFKEMWSTIKSGNVWKGRITNKKKNGERYTVNGTIIPIINERGEILEYIAIRYDITELEAYREILETKLSDTDYNLQVHLDMIRQYQNAIEHASSFCRFDAKGTILYVNETMCSVAKLDANDMLGHSVIALGLLSARTFSEIFSAISKGETWNGIIECHHHAHIACFLDATFSPIFERGELKEIMCISHDVTPLYKLYQEIEDTQKEVVFTMGAIGESRSQETGNHVKRVAEYSKLLATLVGLKKEEAELIRQASPMHDIGKVGIPDAILNKPGKLDPDEWTIMQTHAQLGYEMLKHSSRSILKAAAIVAHEHHEKWNGKGYPRGLKEQEIHIYGRITAIADVFDALGSDRCYKKGWELERILDYFKAEREVSFDPTLVDLLLHHIDQFLEIREHFKDNF